MVVGRSCTTGATGLEPATSGVTDPSGNMCFALVSQIWASIGYHIWHVPASLVPNLVPKPAARRRHRMATSFNGALVIREQGDRVFYEAKWRDSRGRQVKRRVGPAWVERDRAGRWRRRSGRVPDGCFDEKAAIVEWPQRPTKRRVAQSARHGRRDGRRGGRVLGCGIRR